MNSFFLLLGLFLNQICTLSFSQLSHQKRRFAQRKKQEVGVGVETWGGTVDFQLEKSNDLISDLS